MLRALHDASTYIDVECFSCLVIGLGWGTPSEAGLYDMAVSREMIEKEAHHANLHAFLQVVVGSPGRVLASAATLRYSSI